MKNNKNNKLPSFEEFINENIWGDKPKENAFQRAKREREEREREEAREAKEREEKFNDGVEVLDDGEEQLDGINPKTGTSFKNLYIGNTENGYYKLPRKLGLFGIPTFVGKPQYKSNKDNTIYSHYLCIDNTVLNYIGSGLVGLASDINYDKLYDEDATLTDKEKVLKAVINTPYYDEENNLLKVENPNLTKGKIYIGKSISGDKIYGGIFSNTIEIIDDAGHSVLVPQSNFRIPHQGEYTKEEQEKAISNNKFTFEPLSSKLGMRLNDRNLTTLRIENEQEWKQKLKDSNVINFGDIDSVIKNLNPTNKFYQSDVPHQDVEIFNGDVITVPGDMIYYVRFSNNPTYSRAIGILPKAASNDYLGAVTFVDMIFINEVFGGKREAGRVLYSSADRNNIFRKHAGKRYYNAEKDMRNSPKYDEKYHKKLKGNKKSEYEGMYILKSISDVPLTGPSLKSDGAKANFVNEIEFDIDTLQMRYKKGKNAGKLFEFTEEKYEQYKEYCDTFFAQFRKTTTSGRKTTAELIATQDIFPPIPDKIRKGDKRYEFMLENFRSHSDYSKNGRVYEMKSRSNFWFLLRFYNEFVLPSPVIQLMAGDETLTKADVDLFNTPFDIPNDIDWGEVINNHSVSVNKTNVFAEIFYGMGKHITKSRFPSNNPNFEEKENSWKKAKEFKDYTSKLDSGKKDNKGNKIYKKSDFYEDSELYMANRDRYVECLVRTRKLSSFKGTEALGLFDLPLSYETFVPTKPKEAYYKVLRGEITLEEFNNYGNDINPTDNNNEDNI